MHGGVSMDTERRRRRRTRQLFDTHICTHLTKNYFTLAEGTSALVRSQTDHGHEPAPRSSHCVVRARPSTTLLLSMVLLSLHTVMVAPIPFSHLAYPEAMFAGPPSLRISASNLGATPFSGHTLATLGQTKSARPATGTFMVQITSMKLEGSSRPDLILPRVIAHRGAREIAPENTMAAIKAAKNLGMTFCEVDVMLSKDKTVFVHHDHVLGRCSDGEGYFVSKTAAEIQALDAGKWFGTEFAGERVPLLVEVLKLCSDIGLGLNIEIKHMRVKADDVPTDEQTVAERLAAIETCRVVQQFCEDGGRLCEQICFSSFSVAALEECMRLLPSVPRSLLVEAIPDGWASDVHRLNAVSLNFNQKKCTKEQVQSIFKSGTSMFCYTVNDGDRALELLSWGVSGIFSDCPDKIEAAIHAKHPIDA